jgi:hypothetical protein
MRKKRAGGRFCGDRERAGDCGGHFMLDQAARNLVVISNAE